MLIPPFYFKIGLKDTFFHTSRNSLRLYLSPDCLLNFLSNLYIQPCVEKSFKFMMFTFLEHELNLGILTQLPRPLFKLSLNFLSSNPRQRETTHSPGDSFSRNCSPQQKQGVEETMICFIGI